MALRRLARRDTEALLADEDVLALRETARFRDLLVHSYVAVDDRRVVEILHTRVDDLQRFREALADAARGD